MITVILAEKTFLEYAKDYYLFLQPFFDKGGFAVCEWNPQGETVPEMFPDLYDTVGKHTEWRAIAVAPFEGFDLKKKNPFDVTDFVDAPVEGIVLFGEEPKIQVPDFVSRTHLRRAAYEKASKSPLVRLGLCLGREYWNDLPSVSYEQEKKRIEQLVQNLGSAENGDDDPNIAKELANIRESVEYLEFLREKEIARNIVEGLFDENVREKHLLLPTPLELYFISPRQFDNTNYDIATSAETSGEERYSRFAQFNMYPASARFIVYDMHETSHSQYEYDFVCFLEFLFTFATNAMPQSKMRPERLYRAICDNNFNLLAEFLLRYEKKLAVTEKLLRKQHDELTEENKEVLPDDVIGSRYCSDIAVLAAAAIPDRVGIDSQLKSFGLFRRQYADLSRLSGYGEKIRVALMELRKKNFRAILAQCGRTRDTLGDFGEMTDKLTPLQEKDIIDFALERENMMTSMPQMINAGQNTKEIDRAESDTAKVLGQRVSFKKFAFALTYTAVAFLFGYIVFLTDRQPGAPYPYSHILMILAAFGSVVLASLAAVFILRFKLKKALAGYSHAVMRHIHREKGFVDNYSLLLSRICEIARSYAVVDFARTGKNQRTAKAYIIKKHILDIIAARDAAADIFGKFKLDNLETDSYDMVEPYEFDFAKPVAYKYDLPFAESDIRKIRFMGSELAGEIPIGFIGEIDVIREEI